MRRRRLILLIGLPIYAFALMLAGTALLWLIFEGDASAAGGSGFVDDLLGLLDEPEWWGNAGVFAVVIVAVQAIFLVPVFSNRPPRETRGRSLTVSLGVAGLIAAILTMGLGAALLDLVMILWKPDGDIDDKGGLWVIPLFMLAAGWVIWSLLLLFFARGIWADRVLGRIVGLLLAGTLLEILVVLPLDVMVRRRTSCYCATGTFATLVLAATAALWLTGPGIVIALTSKRHRMWRVKYCEGCGYAKGPSPGDRCPECGCEWREPRGRKPSGK